MPEPVVLIGPDALARNYAQRIAADPDASGAYEAGLLDVPPEVARHLEPLLRRPARAYGGDSHLIGDDDA